MVNAYAEKSVSGTLMVYKRPGLTSTIVLPAGSGQGIFNWLGDIYVIIGGNFYKNTTLISAALSGSGLYTFSSTRGATPTLFLHNSTFAWKYDSVNGLVVVDPPQFGTLADGQAYLDGTTYVMLPDATIYGSGINAVDSGSWGALTYIVAQSEPDQGIMLEKQLVYVVALKQWSVEIFYDAGNPSGSPLGAVQGAKINLGCRAAGSVCNIEGKLFWVSAARNGNVGVVTMESLKLQSIATDPIVRLLQQADFTVVWSFGIKINGHSFYVLTLKNSNLTLVYDASTGLWSQWTDANGNYFPFVSATFSTNQQILLQHETNGIIYTMDQVHFTDNGAIIPVDIYTPNYDGGTRIKKVLWKVDFVADQTPGSIVLARNSDDDYQTWTNFRTLDLSKKRAYLTNCGTFFQRAYHFHHTGNVPFRIQAVDLHLEIGSL